MSKEINNENPKLITELKYTSWPSWQTKEHAVQTPAFPSGVQVKHEKIACLLTYPFP